VSYADRYLTAARQASCHSTPAD